MAIIGCRQANLQLVARVFKRHWRDIPSKGRLLYLSQRSMDTLMDKSLGNALFFDGGEVRLHRNVIGGEIVVGIFQHSIYVT